MGIGADPPQEMPAAVPQEPAGRKKTCKECSGSGKKPLLFLGAPGDPCPVCAGTGTIEVVEEPLTPWQQRIEKLLLQILAYVEPAVAQILAYVEPGVARDEAEDRALTVKQFARPTEWEHLNTPEVSAKCQEIIRDFLMKERLP